jgi:hypothetical protein
LAAGLLISGGCACCKEKVFKLLKFGEGLDQGQDFFDVFLDVLAVFFTVVEFEGLFGKVGF